MGPPGACPCVLRSRGEKVPATDLFMSSSLIDLLTEEEQAQLDDLKGKALARYIISNIHTS